MQPSGKKISLQLWKLFNLPAPLKEGMLSNINKIFETLMNEPPFRGVGGQKKAVYKPPFRGVGGQKKQWMSPQLGGAKKAVNDPPFRGDGGKNVGAQNKKKCSMFDLI